MRKERCAIFEDMFSPRWPRSKAVMAYMQHRQRDCSTCNWHNLQVDIRLNRVVDDEDGKVLHPMLCGEVLWKQSGSLDAQRTEIYEAGGEGVTVHGYPSHPNFRNASKQWANNESNAAGGVMADAMRCKQQRTTRVTRASRRVQNIAGIACQEKNRLQATTDTQSQTDVDTTSLACPSQKETPMGMTNEPSGMPLKWDAIHGNEKQPDHKLHNKGHRGGNTCAYAGCTKKARECLTDLCKAHGGGRGCRHGGCSKSAQGCTDLCIAHGGGKRCTHLGCTKSAFGRSRLCIAHGGGTRCTHEGCTKAEQGSTGLCIAHGGGRRCTHEGCATAARTNSGLCIAHGGGRKCTQEGCIRKAQKGTDGLCDRHSGWVRENGRCATYSTWRTLIEVCSKQDMASST